MLANPVQPVVESVFKDCDLERGRVWVVAAGAASTKVCWHGNQLGLQLTICLYTGTICGTSHYTAFWKVCMKV